MHTTLQNPSPKGSALKQAGLVFLLALVIRAIYAWHVAPCPLFRVPTIDAGAYYDLARQFAAGDWLAPVGKPYWQPPFYSMLLALWMQVFGESVSLIKAGQLALGSVNCVLVYALGSRVFDRKVGLIAGVAAALCGPMVYFDGELLTPTLQVFLNLSAILVMLSAVRGRSWWRFAAAGLLLGLSIVLRPDAAVFAACALVWMGFALRGERLARIAALCAMFAACAVLPTIPFAVRNYTVGRDAVLISSNGGLNFYIGNNPDEQRTRDIRPGPEWDAMQELPLKRHPKAKPSEQSAWFYRRSLRYAASDPFGYAKLLAKKSVMYLSAVEGRRNNDLYFNRSYSPLYSALVFKWGGFGFPFGLVLPLAVLGLLRRGRTRESGLLALYLASGFAVTVAFFVCARYRVTAVPVFLIFAAAGAVELPKLWKRREVALLCVAAGVLILANLNLAGVDRDQRIIDADTHFQIGQIYSIEHSPACARELATSIRLNPSYEPARFVYSDALAALGRLDEQEQQLLECVKLDPKSPAAHERLGEISERRGDLSEAVRRYAIAARGDSSFADRLVSVAEKAYARQDYALAERALRCVVSAKPKWAEARRSLGVTLMKLGKIKVAIHQLQIAVELDPESTDALIALGLAYHRAGDTSLENLAFRRARGIGPRSEIDRRIDEALRRM